MEAMQSPPAGVETLSGGQRLSLARRTANLDQDDLATSLQVSRATVSRWERDLGEPTLSQAATIALETGWPLEWLAGLSTRSRCFASLALVEPGEGSSSTSEQGSLDDALADVVALDARRHVRAANLGIRSADC